MEVDVEAVEEELVKAPFEVERWCEYLHVKLEAPFEKIRRAVFERAVHHLPGSYKLWAKFLAEYARFARGQDPDGEACQGCVAAFERALIYMHKMPVIWIEYTKFLEEQNLVTKCRLAYDRALRSLPVTQHERIWPAYVDFVDRFGKKRAWQLGVHVYPRYLQFKPNDAERYLEYLLDAGQYSLAMEQLSRIVLDKEFVSTKGKTSHDLWMELCKLMTTHPEKAKACGVNRLDVEGLIRAGLSRFGDETGRLWCSLAEYYIKLGQFDKAQDTYEEAVTKVTTVRDFGTVFDAYAQFHEALLNAKIDLFDEDEDTSDKYFYDINIGSEDKINDVDLRLAQMEKLMDERPFLLNAVILRQNPHNCVEWQNRAKLFRDRDDLVSVVQTYKDAIDKVNPALAFGELSSIWLDLARVYEDNDDLEEARSVLDTAIESPFKKIEDLEEVFCGYAEMELRNKNYQRALSVLEKALRAPSERQELEKLNLIRQKKMKGYQDISKEEKAELVQEKTKMQGRLYKSTKLWSFYADLEECIGTLKTARAAYEKMIDMKIATPQTILNYANMLEENRFFEDSFQAYEKGVQLFDWPHVGDIWINYLSKFLKRYQGKKLIRAREMFQQALENAPKESCKPLYLLLAFMEEQYGDPRKAMSAYDRLCQDGPEDQRTELYLLYAGKAEEYFGISKAREVYEKAIENLEDHAQIREICLRYAEKERRLGEMDRARAVFQHGSQFADPRTVLSYWKAWNDFEVAHGNENTFKEMLRVKRLVGVQFNSQTNFAFANANEKNDTETTKMTFQQASKLQPASELMHVNSKGPEEVELEEPVSKKAKF